MNGMIESLLLLTWLWPLMLAALLAWPLLRRHALALLPWALVPAWLLWLALQTVALPLTYAWPNVLLGLSLRADDLTPIWLGLSVLVWTAAALHSRWVNDHQAWRFGLFFLLSLCGSLILVLAADAVSFYLGFSLMSLAAWGLVMHEATAEAKRAARWYVQLAIIGELLLFIGIVARSAQLGTTDLTEWTLLASADWVWWLLWLGLAIKVGVPVLHVWLPLAHPAAPVAASAVLSGVMIKAGIIGWLVLLPPNPMVFGGADWMLWLGVFTMLFGGVIGLMQTQPKAILAYSSISQMGWLIWAVGLVWQSQYSLVLIGWLAWFALHHALVKGALFLGVGWVQRTPIHSRLHRWIWLGLIVLALMMAGLPLTSGAWVKYGLKTEAALLTHTVPEWLLLAGAVMTGLLMIHFVRRLARIEVKPQPLVKSALVSWWLLIVIGLVLPWWQGAQSPTWPQAMSDLQPFLLALVIALAWRIRLQRSVTCPQGDMVVWYEAGGRWLMRQVKRHQAWWLHQQQHLKWAQLKWHQVLRRVSQPIVEQEQRLKRWPNFVSAFVALILLSVVLLVL